MCEYQLCKVPAPQALPRGRAFAPQLMTGQLGPFEHHLEGSGLPDHLDTICIQTHGVWFITVTLGSRTFTYFCLHFHVFLLASLLVLLFCVLQ